MNNWRPGARYWGGDPWINNWQSYNGLYAPPYGYRWIQSGNQFLLTAIATGIISAVVVNGMAMGGPR
jgi:Ni/Co efflux regulator RcnB